MSLQFQLRELEMHKDMQLLNVLDIMKSKSVYYYLLVANYSTSTHHRNPPQ